MGVVGDFGGHGNSGVGLRVCVVSGAGRDGLKPRDETQIPVKIFSPAQAGAQVLQQDHGFIKLGYRPSPVRQGF